MLEEKSEKPLMRHFDQLGETPLKLGETDILITFQTREELAAIAATLISQASHEIDYYARRFDREVLGQTAVVDELQYFMRKNRNASIKTLVQSSQELVQSGHRLVEVLRQSMPEVQCRVRRPGSSNSLFTGSFLTVDSSGYLNLPDPDRYAGSACFNNPGMVDKFRGIFKDDWQVADPDPEMQPLYL